MEDGFFHLKIFLKVINNSIKIYDENESTKNSFPIHMLKFEN